MADTVIKGEGIEGLSYQEGKDGVHDVISYFMDGPPSKAGYTGPMARVKFSASLTIQIAPYQNVTPRVELELLVHPARVNEAYDWIKEWVDNRLLAIKEGVQGTRESGGD